MNLYVLGFLILGLMLEPSLSYAAPPKTLNTLTYQGRILKTDGTPLENASVSFLFEVTSPNGLCLIYREQVNGINMVGSNGVFDVPIGSGSRIYPATPFTLSEAFNNSKDIACDGGSTYTPAFDDVRLLRVQFHDGVGWNAITPNSEIRSVPYAYNAFNSSTLGGKLPTDFVLKNSVSTCLAGQYLTFDGTNFTCQNDAGGAGMVSDVNVTAPLTKGGTASIPSIGISVGTAAGTVAAGNDSRFGNALKIQNVLVDATAPTNNQVLKFDGSSYVPSSLAISDITSLQTQLNNKINATMFPASCTAGQSLVFVSPANTFDCYDITITAAQISGNIPGAKISGNIAGNSAGFTGSLTGDVSGTQAATSVDKIKGVAVDSTAPVLGQVLKYDGTKWAPGTDTSSGGTVTNVSGTAPISVTSGASTPVVAISQATTSTNGYLSSADWNTFNGKQVSGNYITALTGDVTATGPNSAASTVAKLQGSILTITTPANKDYLKYNGSAFVNSPLLASELSGVLPVANLPAFAGGDVTSSSGSAVLTLAAAGTAGTYYKVTTDSKGRVTSGAAFLVAADIPALDWAKITTGKPTTLSGYGITDSLVSNAGGTPSIQTGLDASKPASPSAGAIFFATDSKVIYQYNSGSWISIASATGSGGTITGVTAGTGLSGGGTSGAVTLNLANTAVTAGSYTRANVTVDAQGRLTAAANGAAVNLASEVTGVLPIANGGTGASTAITAFNALSPISTKGALITNDGTNDVALTVGTNGQVLSADSTQSGGLKWVTPTNGTVTSVTGTLPIVIATGTTTPAISVNAATTSAQGVVQVGSGIAVSSGTISADPANFPSLVPISKGGTGASAIAANGLVAANGTGTAYTSFACGVGQTITFNASGVAACQTFTAAGFFINGGNSFGAAATLGTNDAYGLNFETNNSVAMAIDSSGKVGIGTTSPSFPLDVQSSTSFQARFFQATNNQYDGSALMMTRTRGTLASNTAVTSGDTIGGIYFRAHDGSGTGTTNSSVEVSAGENHSTTNRGTYMIFETTTNGSATRTEKMRIHSNGNVGIGTTTPAYPLSVYKAAAGATSNVESGNAGSVAQNRYAGLTAGSAAQVWGAGMNISNGNAGYEIYDYTAGASRLLVNTAGNVGIGTTSPTTKFDVRGGVASINTDYVAGSTGSGVAIFQGAASGNTNGSIQQYTSGGTGQGVLALNPLGGNVGIGTTTPQVKFSVQGASGSTALMQVQNSDFVAGTVGSGAYLGTVANTGNVGAQLQAFYNGNTTPGPLYLNPYLGNVGVGVNSGLTADKQLTVNGDIAVGMDKSVGTYGYGNALWFRGNDPTTDSVWMAKYDAAADISYLRVNVGDEGSDYFVVGSTTGGSPGGAFTNAFWVKTDGSGWIAGTLTQASDARLKKNIQPLKNSLDKITQLEGVTYNWIDKRKPAALQLGLIAQEVEKIYPEVVANNEDGYKSVAYQNLVAPIISALSEVKAWLQHLTDKSNDHEGRLQALEAHIKSQDAHINQLEEQNRLLRESLEQSKKRE